jgi:hypothetical protein
VGRRRTPSLPAPLADPLTRRLHLLARLLLLARLHLLARLLLLARLHLLTRRLLLARRLLLRPRYAIDLVDHAGAGRDVAPAELRIADPDPITLHAHGEALPVDGRHVLPLPQVVHRQPSLDDRVPDRRTVRGGIGLPCLALRGRDLAIRGIVRDERGILTPREAILKAGTLDTAGPLAEALSLGELPDVVPDMRGRCGFRCRRRMPTRMLGVGHSGCGRERDRRRERRDRK